MSGESWVDKIHGVVNSVMPNLPPPTRDQGPPGETFSEKLVRKTTAEPLVPIGCLVTVGFLSMGLRAFHKGNAVNAQKLMRGRVMAQGFTVAVMLIGAYNGFKPGGDRPKDYEEKLARQHTPQ